MTDLMLTLGRWEWIAALVARLVVGLMFALSGYGKLFVPATRQQMQETIRAAGLPSPVTSATVLSWIEFLAGASLVLGLLTPVAAVLLSGVMIGALVTTHLPAVKAASLADWLGEVTFLPQTLTLVLLIWLSLSGPGFVSLDGLLFGG